MIKTDRTFIEENGFKLIIENNKALDGSKTTYEWKRCYIVGLENWNTDMIFNRDCKVELNLEEKEKNDSVVGYTVILNVHTHSRNIDIDKALELQNQIAIAIETQISFQKKINEIFEENK